MAINPSQSMSKNFLWMVFVAALLAEHGYAGMKVHDVLVEKAVTESRLEDSQKMSRMLASIASHFVPNLTETALNLAGSNGSNGSKRAASQPPDVSGIFISEASSEEQERTQQAAIDAAKKVMSNCKGKQCK